MKTKRKQPHKQGCMQEISDLFLVPLIRCMPESRGIRQYLEDIFHTDTRKITCYEAKRNFEFVGSDAEIPLKPVPGIKSGKILKSGQVWVRIDSTHDDRVDVEFFVGRTQETKVFQITNKVFKTDVLPNLEIVNLPAREQRFLLGNAWVLKKYTYTKR